MDFEPIKTPFAESGNKDTIADTSPNYVNWETGFPRSYSKSIEDGGQLVKRTEMNAIINKICKAIRYFQIGGLAMFNTAFTTGGRKYERGAVLWYKLNGVWTILEATADTTVAPNSSNIGTTWKPYTLLGFDSDNRPTASAFSIGELFVKTKLLFSGTKATGCPTPVEKADFANKQYIDDIADKLVGFPNYAQAVDIKSRFTPIGGTTGQLWSNVYTAESSGWICLQFGGNDKNMIVRINGYIATNIGSVNQTYANYTRVPFLFPVRAGDRVDLNLLYLYGTPSYLNKADFIPCRKIV